jgi:hypothetical protein
MGMLGKVLAILNILAAIGFLVLAGLDYGKRQSWELAVLEQDFILNGLPVDDQEKDLEGKPLAGYLGPNLRQALFSGARGQPVTTQKEEVAQRRQQLEGEINGQADEAGKRRVLGEILVPLARTLGEREDLRQQLATGKLDGLLARFEAAFHDALQGRTADNKELELGPWKAAIAHVLVNTAKPEEAQRSLAVVGVAAYTRELDTQASALQSMLPSMEQTMTEDRAAFELKHKALLQQILTNADRLRDLDDTLQKQVAVREEHNAQVQRRKADVASLHSAIDATRKTAAAALAEQTRLEKELVAALRKVDEMDRKNQELERTLRERESVSAGEGRR